jgi:hypothetical protein
MTEPASGPPTSQRLFQTADGEDAYDGSSGWFAFYHGALIVYGLGWFASLPLIINATVENTYTKANNFGILYSNRYVQLYWYALAFSCLRMLVFLVMCSMILFRQTTTDCGDGRCCRRGRCRCCCRGQVPCCSIFWASCLGVLFLFELFVLATLGAYWNDCNGLQAVDNPCNAYVWCCDPLVAGNPANLCPNPSAACIDPTVPKKVSQMPWNTDFLWLMSTTIVFFAFDLLFLLVPVAAAVHQYIGGGTQTISRDTERAVDEQLMLLGQDVAARRKQPIVVSGRDNRVLASLLRQRKTGTTVAGGATAAATETRRRRLVPLGQVLKK